MNRIVLIGNGFDLAHGLKTSYQDFINWYWEQKAQLFLYHPDQIDDMLVSIKTNTSNYHTSTFIYNELRRKGIIWPNEFHEKVLNNSDAFKVTYSQFFNSINKSVETKGWVDIENEYYLFLKGYAIDNQENKARTLNEQLKFIQELLTKYLRVVYQEGFEIKQNIMEAIYAPINPQDVSIEAKNEWEKTIEFWKSKNEEDWLRKLQQYGITDEEEIIKLIDEANRFKPAIKGLLPVPALFRLPDKIMLLNYNYTETAHSYLRHETQAIILNNIHGQLEQPESIIFGHGDEMDEKFKQIQNLNIQEYLKNVKSINYLNSDNYRKLLRFIDSAPYQICIMGHSCGLSDRTLLNTLFEHKNCISIKPYYHIYDDGTDNYIEIAQNISRSFNDMALMRDRVVNKTYCESMD